ncbi:leucine-rich repeat-containing protein 17 [Chanos chanos]|uniref:Leucine-rich repeat-containing protein 17 n=1 Tax=Chanos chanos TaxID=29144 RepID=A0A6J2WKS6_CHACN|nr:leucine-rich repeat-containing protein 17 [Chanos chanos]
MRLFAALLVLLVLTVALAGKGGRSKGRNRIRGRGRGSRAGAVKRFAAECKEYVEDGKKVLDCQERQLTTIPLGWPDDIEHLLLARNKIRILRNDAFAQFRYLKSLDLQQNEISHIEEGAFNGLSQLSILLLQHNRLQLLTEEVLLPMPRLHHLRLHDNPWRCDCQLDSLVRTLQLPSNRNMGNFAKCAEPSALWGQKLKKVDLELMCPDLQGSSGARPQLPQQQGGSSRPRPPAIQRHPDATSLCHTYMSPKPLLDCKNRELKIVPPDIPGYIVKMDLSSNNITQLRPKEFLAAKELKLLNLSSNNLQQIDMAAFAGLLYLRELDLSNNSLHYFQYGVLEDLYFLRKLSLGNNLWMCDYNIHYLIYWLKHHPSVEYSGLVCSDPPEFRGWPVENYVKTYNAECPKDKQVAPQTDNDQGGTTVQELTADLEEEALPSPIRVHDKFEIIRLS